MLCLILPFIYALSYSSLYLCFVLFFSLFMICLILLLFMLCLILIFIYALSNSSLYLCFVLLFSLFMFCLILLFIYALSYSPHYLCFVLFYSLFVLRTTFFRFCRVFSFYALVISVLFDILSNSAPYVFILSLIFHLFLFLLLSLS